MRASGLLRRGAAVVVAALVVGLAACSAAPDVEVEPSDQLAALPTDTVDQLEDAVTRAMAAVGAPGAIVGVWAPWSGQWVAALGTQSVDGGQLEVDQQFRAGRITRAMTCDALYALAEEGVLALDDSIADYVAGVADAREVTLAQLCASTSGIGSYAAQLSSTWYAVPKRLWPARELATYGLGQPRTSEPGEAYRDSDAGYVLLGLALERATGQSLTVILHENVFAPLGLENTRMPADGADAAGLIRGYHTTRDSEGVAMCADPFETTAMASSFGFGDAGVVTDIHDLGAYARHLAAETLTSNSAGRYDDPRPVSSREPTWYSAMGGVVVAGSLRGQFGTVPGYATAAFSDPESGLTVAVMLNNSGVGSTLVRNLAFELAAIASKAHPAPGETAPEAGLPWTAQQYHEAITNAAVCPLPTPEDDAAGD